MVTNEAQAESVLYGELGAVSGTELPFRFLYLYFVISTEPIFLSL